MAYVNTQTGHGPSIKAGADRPRHGSDRREAMSRGLNRSRISWLGSVKEGTEANQRPVLNVLFKAALNIGILLAAMLVTFLIMGTVGMLHQTTTTVETRAAAGTSILLPEKKLPPVREEIETKQELKQTYTAMKKLPEVTKTQPKFEFANPTMGIDANFSGVAIKINTFDIPQVKTEYLIGEVDQVPVPTLQFPPDYPYHAKRQGTEGVVSIRFLVTSEGKVSSFSVLKGVPEGVFDEATRRCVLRWKFQPGMKDGERVDTWVEMDIEFELG